MKKKQYRKPLAKQYSSFSMALGSCFVGEAASACDTGNAEDGNAGVCAPTGAQYSDWGCGTGQDNRLGCGIGNDAQ